MTDTAALRPRPVPAAQANVTIVANANAGMDTPQGRENEALISVMEERFRRPGSDVHINLQVLRTGTFDDLKRAKEQILAVRPHYLFIFGGDGTIQRLLGSDDDFLERLYKTGYGPMIAFFGGGSTNVIKGELKVLDQDRFRGATRLIDKIRSGVGPDHIYRAVLRIIGKNGRVYKGFIYGSGLTARFLERYNAKSPKGRRRAVLVVLTVLWNEIVRLFWWKRPSIARKVPLSFELFRESSPEPELAEHMRTSGTIMSSLNQVGMGCTLTYRATERVRHFHAVISGLGFWSTAANALFMFTKSELYGNVRSEVVSRVVLRYEAPVMHTIDGELYSSEQLGDTVVIESGPYLPIVKE